MKKLHILVSAHEFSPLQGSECSVGWNTVINLAKYHRITVLFAETNQFQTSNYKEAVSKYLKDNNLNFDNRIDFVSIKQPKITRLIAWINKKVFGNKISSIGLPALYYLGYRFWQKAVYDHVKKVQLHRDVDAIHLLTGVTFRDPGYLWKLTDNFYWGPTGGTETLKYSFFKEISFKGKIIEYMRTVSNLMQFHFSLRIYNAIKKAKHIYLFDRQDEDRFHKKGAQSLSLMIDTGTFSQFISSSQKDLFKPKVEVIWCGQIIELKQLNILLEAISRDEFIRNNIVVRIVGEGPLKKELQSKYIHLSPSVVHWIGSIPHSKIFEIIESSDVLVHTSFREAASAVILESMSLGLAIICHDISGMTLAVTDECGYKIPFVSPDFSINYLINSLRSLIEDRALLSSMQKASVCRAYELSWENKALEIAKRYNGLG